MTSRDDTQYSLLKILTIWAIVAIPMPILAFVVAPMIAPQGHWHYLLSAWLMLICGMIWQFIVSVWILYHELDDFTWTAIKARIWLQAPRNPNTGARSYKLFWWLIPAFLFYAAFEASPVGTFLGELILIPIPGLAGLPVLDLQDLVGVPELVGAWCRKVMAGELSRDRLEALRGLFERNRGDCSVQVHLVIPGESETVLSLPDARGVEANDTLVGEVDALFGRPVAELSL
jgi:hypothetical protein